MWVELSKNATRLWGGAQPRESRNQLLRLAKPRGEPMELPHREKPSRRHRKGASGSDAPRPKRLVAAGATVSACSSLARLFFTVRETAQSHGPRAIFTPPSPRRETTIPE